jgi:hypothetical protein
MDELQRYNRAYYQAHKKRISEKKKLRWREDAKYREQINARREKALALRREQCLPRGRKAGGQNTTRVFVANGETRLVYSIGTVARFFARHYTTLERWARSRLLPVIVDERGHFWFDQVVIQKCCGIMEELSGATYSSKRRAVDELKTRIKQVFHG